MKKYQNTETNNLQNIISGLLVYFYGGTTLLQWWLNFSQRKKSWAILPFFFSLGIIPFISAEWYKM